MRKITLDNLHFYQLTDTRRGGGKMKSLLWKVQQSSFSNRNTVILQTVYFNSMAWKSTSTAENSELRNLEIFGFSLTEELLSTIFSNYLYFVKWVPFNTLYLNVCSLYHPHDKTLAATTNNRSNIILLITKVHLCQWAQHTYSNLCFNTVTYIQHLHHKSLLTA
jgi:hypothetical protein